MANLITHPTWKLDTAGVITTTPVFVIKIIWQPGAASASLVIKDSLGVIEIEKQSIAAWPIDEHEIDFPGNGKRFNGFNLHTMTNGNLLVYTTLIV